MGRCPIFQALQIIRVYTKPVGKEADFTDPLFGLVFLKGNFYKFFSIALDLAGLAALIMLAGVALSLLWFRRIA